MRPLRATLRQMDLVIPCHCGAKAGKICKGGVIHIGRRIHWLLKTVEARHRGKLVIR
jgi:hypothetical protein